jgi:predicted RNA-binding Zn-ribbon protein involved in translation (DUF1610 family)
MAMIKCHECGKQISDVAANCPKCGALTRKQASNNLAGAVIAVFIFALLYLFVFK